jgi:lipopolysaccharide/colanic/teichoic acid biosynthesis glycosyltransferase
MHYFAVKRVLDIIVSLIGIICLSWLFLIAAIAVKLQDGGPVLFKQVRIGRHGKHFEIYKFRSMKVGSHEVHADYDEEEDKISKVDQDDRITFVGKFLRKTSIDELPQLFNIFKGEMSLIGPRAFMAHDLQKMSEFNGELKLLVPQGLTGAWQVYKGRHDLSAEETTNVELKYVNNFGFKQDIKIFFQTFIVLFKFGHQQ